MAYQRRILATGTVFNIADNGFWSFADLNGDGSQDLVYIKTRNTDNGKIEVHGSYNESRFQQHNVATGTAFGIEDNGTWLMQDWTGDGKADLVYIKTRNTGTGMVEVHVADAASGYQKFVLQTCTCFICEDNGIWTMSSKGDLVFIKTRNCDSKMIEYHVASKVSNYQQFTQHVTTGFGVEDNGTWCLAPKCDGDFADLYYIKTRNTESGMVEVHAVSASSGWKSRLIDVPSSFSPEDNGQWLMVDFTHQKQPDLGYIKTKSTGTGKIEVHIVERQEVVPRTFMDSSRNVRLDSDVPNVLRAELQRNNGSWRDAAIDLNMFLGNIDGKFTWDKKLFQELARGTKLEEAVLSAELRKTDGSWGSDSFDLRDVIMNNDGVFQVVPRTFMRSSRNVRLDSDVLNMLRADLQRNNGTWCDAAIDLNMFLGNIDGKFTWNKMRFQVSARGTKLEEFVLSAQLRKINGSWVSDSFDLRDFIINNDGVFQAVNVPADQPDQPRWVSRHVVRA